MHSLIFSPLNTDCFSRVNYLSKRFKHLVRLALLILYPVTVAKVQLTTRERPCGGNRPQLGCYGLATHISRLPHPIRAQEPPNLATESLESARAGEQEDSLTYLPVMTLGMNMTMNEEGGNTIEKPAAGQVLQTCVCGWAKVTSTHGLKVHQERMKCLKTSNPGPRIDQILLRRRLNQSDDTQRQEEPHCLQSISTLLDEEGVFGRTISPTQYPAHRKGENIQGRKALVKWPKSNSKEWVTINTDLSLILSHIKGSAEKKLEKRGDLIYNYGEEKFGVKEQVRKNEMFCPLPTVRTSRLVLYQHKTTPKDCKHSACCLTLEIGSGH